MISIIIPTYNCEKYIKFAIESALNQTYEDKEIIVVDDGSTDNTLDIITQIADITVLIKPNGGTADALNTGIRNANGDWIKWLSADDMLYPDALELMMNSIEKMDHTDNSIFYSHYDIIDESGIITGHFEEPKTREKGELWKRFYGNGSTSLIHKKVFAKCGLFDSTMKHSEDYEFWLRCSEVYGVKLQLVDEYTLKYRVHKDQLTNKIGGSLDEEIRKKIQSLIV